MQERETKYWNGHDQSEPNWGDISEYGMHMGQSKPKTRQAHMAAPAKNETPPHGTSRGCVLVGTKADASMSPINKVACGTCTRDGEYAKTVEIVANREPAKPWCTPTEIVENRNRKASRKARVDHEDPSRRRRRNRCLSRREKAKQKERTDPQNREGQSSNGVQLQIATRKGIN